MRIAYICTDPGIPVFGTKGCSIHVQEMIRAFLEQGAEVDLFTNRIDGNGPPGLEKVNVFRLPQSSKKRAEEREGRALEANSYLETALRLRGSYDLVYERYSLWSYAGMDYANDHNIPGILEVNAPLIEEQKSHRELIDPELAERIAKRVFNKASSLVAVSEEVANYLRKYRERREGIHVIPNAINPKNYPDNAFPNTQSDSPFTVGFLGTLKPWHGVSHLIEAFARFHRQDSKTRLVIVGDGPEKESIENLITSYKLEKAVTMKGALPHDQIPSVLKTWDVAVAPYPAIPNFYFSPLKVFEYMAAGLPVIASSIGQIKDLVKNESNGLLCSPGDLNDLTAALHFLKGNPALRKSLGVQARRTVLDRFTWDKVAREVFEIAFQSQLESSIAG